MNKQFEDWLDDKMHEELNGNYGTITFKTLTPALQWGVYLEFFDSVGIMIQVEWNSFDFFFFGMIRDSNKKTRVDSLEHRTRPEAQQESIKTAFETLMLCELSEKGPIADKAAEDLRNKLIADK